MEVSKNLDGRCVHNKRGPNRSSPASFAVCLPGKGVEWEQHGFDTTPQRLDPKKNIHGRERRGCVRARYYTLSLHTKWTSLVLRIRRPSWRDIRNDLVGWLLCENRRCRYVTCDGRGCATDTTEPDMPSSAVSTP